MKLDIIGDVHGCFEELRALTTKLGYSWDSGYPVHPEERKLAFVGDLTDRGPFSLGVVNVVCTLIEKKLGYYVPGNHCNKLYRYFLGRKVQITHGLETTVEELKHVKKKDREIIKNRFMKLYDTSPLYQVLDDGKLIIAHAGIKEEYIGKHSDKVKTFVLYGDITGETNPDGSPVRKDWAKSYSGNAVIVYGHTPVKEVRKVNHTYNIDTGAVFGGKLTALSYPEWTVQSVPSSMPFVAEKFRTFE
ncbi:bis(5'-nucleosyl)-tetraphosphatase PrpE [Niallia taxi]|uniref:bis(5'-nucleosyl)-tetraphosphatase PrpE n=1 Tax=Niallia taxi TaxID=2499688 RepID=UPI00203EB1E3|nr:bis(5'-nucleosyl)-tetraphosphatase PrpE [Niallia taxi]MCM3215971.1 bis(5'-nucleosyl)-tetraphosphatase PrpE [Niallia taxi]MED4053253.1 bis(5'-nucleosyl)-tetraphosphatase PrpE [Niallia taxi]MED4119093.1 bis(5'-nucleosyl)-tetraphosphatase PrpE [Niallia taxi]